MFLSLQCTQHYTIKTTLHHHHAQPATTQVYSRASFAEFTGLCCNRNDLNGAIFVWIDARLGQEHNPGSAGLVVELLVASHSILMKVSNSARCGKYRSLRLKSPWRIFTSGEMVWIFSYEVLHLMWYPPFLSSSLNFAAVDFNYISHAE